MIGYELAKELKDAGFPFDFTLTTKDGLNYFTPMPTLEELIEACNPLNPDEFYLGTYLDYWEAIWRNHSARDEDNKDIKTKGSTPTEAVARLYIALHKNVNPN